MNMRDKNKSIAEEFKKDIYDRFIRIIINFITAQSKTIFHEKSIIEDDANKTVVYLGFHGEIKMTIEVKK